ncbi:MAG: hypothetical protein EOO41_05245, partial [Methanobacteriota archaeon]
MRSLRCVLRIRALCLAIQRQQQLHSWTRGARVGACLLLRAAVAHVLLHARINPLPYVVYIRPARLLPCGGPAVGAPVHATRRRLEPLSPAPPLLRSRPRDRWTNDDACFARDAEDAATAVDAGGSSHRQAHALPPEQTSKQTRAQARADSNAASSAGTPPDDLAPTTYVT